MQALHSPPKPLLPGAAFTLVLQSVCFPKQGGGHIYITQTLGRTWMQLINWSYTFIPFDTGEHCFLLFPEISKISSSLRHQCKNAI